MADFGGFNIATPQEVATDQNSFQQKAALSGNAQVMRAANINGALDTLFGSPQMNLAKKLQSRITAAQTAAGAEQNPGESDLDYSIRKLRSVRDSVVDVDPSAAAQMNTQLLKLGEMKFQQNLLSSREKREQDQFDLVKAGEAAKSSVAKINGGDTYVVDTKAPLGEFQAKAFDLQDPAQTGAFTKEAGKPNTIVVTPAQAADLYKNASDNAARMREALAKAHGGVGANTWNDLEKQGSGLVNLYDTVDRVFNVFKQNPDALSSASKGAKELDKLGSQMSAAARAVNGNTTQSGTSIDTWMKANNVTNSRMQGLVIGTAFAIAKAQNGTGRITDRDLVAAKETVGADNPNPIVMLSNLHDILSSQTGALMDRIGYLDADGSAPAFVRAMKQTIGSKSTAYESQWQPYVSGVKAEATGAPQNMVGNKAATGNPLVDKYLSK